MASDSRIGTLSIAVDGEWDMEDLRSVSESMSEAYGLFYPLVAEDQVVRERMQDSLRETFWSGNTDSRFIGERLYRQIPKDESLRLKSFHYASPGTMTVVGVLAVLGMMASVSYAWLRFADKLIDVWKKVDKFFEARRHLRKPKRHIQLDEDMAIDVDDARALVFEVGPCLGFGQQACETLIGITGNPVAALKFLATVGKEGRKLSTLQREGKLALPAPSEEVVLKSSATTRKRMRGQVDVVRTPRRGKPHKDS